MLNEVTMFLLGAILAILALVFIAEVHEFMMYPKTRILNYFLALTLTYLILIILLTDTLL